MASTDALLAGDLDAFRRECALLVREAPIHEAVRAFDADALRRELAAGVSPDFRDGEDDLSWPPLFSAVTYWSGVCDTAFVAERAACVQALLEAGASVAALSLGGETALQCAVSHHAFGDIIDRLIAAGSDVNNVSNEGESVLATAAQEGSAATVKKLISAGATGLDDALVRATSYPSANSLRNCAHLLRAGAALPTEDTLRNMTTDENWRYHGGDDDERLLIRRARTYLERISATPGGFQAYEREHRQRLTAVFADKFPALPVEVISHIVLLWAHCGDYDQDCAVPRAAHWRLISEQIEREREAAAADAEEN